MAEFLFTVLEQYTTSAKNVDELWLRENIMFSDYVSHLSERKVRSWCKVISGVSTTESIEDLLIGPMLNSKNEDPKVKAYLKYHGADESRHHKMLDQYLESSFKYIKTSDTFSDILFHNVFFPMVTKIFNKKPIYGYILLRALEKFSILFYDSLEKCAKSDGMNSFVELLGVVKKDELRHIAGVTELIKYEISKHGPLSRIDIHFVKGLITVMLLDINLSQFAIHNRKMRKSMIEIGIDPEKFNHDCKTMVDESFQFLESLE